MMDIFSSHIHHGGQYSSSISNLQRNVFKIASYIRLLQFLLKVKQKKKRQEKTPQIVLLDFGFHGVNALK